MSRRSPLLATALTAALLAAASSCSSLTEAGAEPVSARTTQAGIVATNHASRPARYLAFEPGWLALVLLVPCSDVNDPCPRIQPGETITIPWSEVGGYTSGPRVYKLTWSLVGTPAASGSIDLPWPEGIR
jgi:hypothetical protein